MTTTSTARGRPDRQSSLTRSRSLGRKPKPAAGPSEHNANSSDGSDHKPDKPLPNYLKPTISSRPDPVRFLKKGPDDSQKLLRRRSFDHPPPPFSSPTTTSTSSPRDRPSVSRDSHKPIAGRSSSLHGSKTGPRGGGGGSVKSPPVGPKGTIHGSKKSGLSTTSSASFHSKKEGSSFTDSNKSSEKETAPPAPAHVEEPEIVKVETDAGVVSDNDREEPRSEDKEVESNESSEEKKGSDQTDGSPVLDCPDATIEEGEVVDEDKAVEQNEETLDDGDEADEESSDEAVAAADVKEAASLKESTDEEKASDTEHENETESSNGKEETSETKAVVAEPPEAAKRQVVQGKKESPSAYNDVIEKTASKLLENRKNKVKALVGAFETVIDYETAASK